MHYMDDCCLVNHFMFFFGKNIRKKADLVIFTEEILNGKLHFWGSASFSYFVISFTGF